VAKCETCGLPHPYWQECAEAVIDIAKPAATPGPTAEDAEVALQVARSWHFEGDVPKSTEHSIEYLAKLITTALANARRAERKKAARDG